MNPLPVRPITVNVSRGRYDFAHPSTEQYCYTFRHLPIEILGVDRFECLADTDVREIDDSAYGITLELQKIFKHYIYTRNKDPLNAIVEWFKANGSQNLLEQCLVTAECAWVRRRYEVEKAERLFLSEIPE